MGIFDKGVKKTNRGFFERLSRAIVGKTEVDDDLLDAIEEALFATDMGVDTTMKIIENLEEFVGRDKYVSMDELEDIREIVNRINVHFIRQRDARGYHSLRASLPKPCHRTLCKSLQPYGSRHSSHSGKEQR